jgi:CRISPR-associated protein Cmr3
MPIRLGNTVALRRGHREAVARWNVDHRVWPVPRDALRLEGDAEVVRLNPMPPECKTLGRDDDDTREALWMPQVARAGKPLSLPNWWSDSDFAHWLSGGRVTAKPETPLQLERRRQAHVAIAPATFTSSEGAIYSHDVIETLEASAEWAIGVEVALPDATRPRIARLGSDGRIALIGETSPDLFYPPPHIAQSFSKSSRGLRLIVVSPACFPEGWVFPGFRRNQHGFRGALPGIDGEVVLRAAFVSRPQPVSGWDMAANGGVGAPKTVSRMVAPGAVYFFERADGRVFGADEASTLWLSAHGERTDEGFGRVVPAIWNGQESL